LRDARRTVARALCVATGAPSRPAGAARPLHAATAPVACRPAGCHVVTLADSNFFYIFFNFGEILVQHFSKNIEMLIQYFYKMLKNFSLSF
jgi:hypothetical protein